MQVQFALNGVASNVTIKLALSSTSCAARNHLDSSFLAIIVVMALALALALMTQALIQTVVARAYLATMVAKAYLARYLAKIVVMDLMVLMALMVLALAQAPVVAKGTPPNQVPALVQALNPVLAAVTAPVLNLALTLMVAAPVLMVMAEMVARKNYASTMDVTSHVRSIN